jgi:hypothetical protein
VYFFCNVPQEADEFFDEQRSFIMRYINMYCCRALQAIWIARARVSRGLHARVARIKDGKAKCSSKVKRRQILVQGMGRGGVALSHLGHMYPMDHPVGESKQVAWFG